MELEGKKAKKSSKYLNLVQEMFDSSPIMMGIVKLTENDILHVEDNQATSNFIGKSLSEIKGKFTSELGTSPEIIQEWRNHYLESRISKTPVWFQYWSRGKFLSVVLSPLFKQKDPMLFSYFVQDLTVYKTDNERLEKHKNFLQQTLLEKDEVLRRESILFEAIFDHAAVGIAQVSPDGRFVRLNQKFCDIVGYEHDELSQLTFAEITHPHDLEADIELAKKLFAGEINTYNMDKRYIRKDGTYTWIHLTASASLDVKGRSEFGIAIVEDINEKKQLETSLKERDLFLQMALSVAGVFTWDLNTVTSELKFTVNAAEVIGKPIHNSQDFFQLVHPEDIDRLHSEFRDTLNQGSSFSSIFRIYHAKTGEIRWIESRGNVIEYFGTEPYRFGGVSIDVTERVKATEALQESAKRFETVTESIPHLVWTTNSKGDVTYFNQRWYEYTGQSAHEALGWGWTKSIHPEDLAPLTELWKNAIATGLDPRAEYRIKSKNDDYRWFLGECHSIKNSKGQIIQWFGASTDIHEQKMARIEVEQALKVRDEFLSVASHELKTPITVLKLHLQLLKDRISKENGEPFTKIKDFAETSFRQAKSLSRLVENLLDVSKIKMKQMNLQLEETDLSELTLDIVNRFDQTLKLAGCTLETKIDNPVYAYVDRVKIEQVVINLLTNAAKYAPHRSIQISLQEKENYAVLSIADEGSGIEKERLERIFEPYTRSDKKSSVSGLGLGLYICKSIVEQHKGSIAVESELSHGSTFHVKIPLNI